MAPSVLEKAVQAQKDKAVFPLPRPTDGTKAYRVEIDEFLADNAMTNLFLIALKELQDESLTVPKTKESNWWSFYSLAGIHGQPRESWAGLGNVGSRGYCHHGMPTFPTWHRAYMFQYEQAIYIRMNQIAAKYPDKQKAMYLDAASRFRLPFWDPVMPRYRDDSNATNSAKQEVTWFWGVPVIFKTKEVYVKYPEKPDELKLMPNPLYQFTFPEATAYDAAKRRAVDFENTTDQGWQLKWDDQQRDWVKVSFDPKCPSLLHTARAPTMAQNGDSDYAFFERNLQAQTRNLATYFWQLLSPVLDDKGTTSKGNEVRTWDMFSNHDDVGADQFVTTDGRRRFYESRSLESWHDTIHGLVSSGNGYAGQMGDPAIAAFDPIFWMHHNNIERMLCIYQALYPDRFVESGKKSDRPPMFKQNRRGERVPDPRIFADDDLYPFINSESKKYYTSTALKDWTKSGFATPGDSNTSDVREEVKAYLLKNYYWATLRRSKPNFDQLQYPKDLTQVEALTGKLQTTAPKPMVIQAISRKDGRASLVSRELALPDLKQAAKQPVDQVVTSSVISEQLALTETVYPAAVLIDVENKDVDTKMSTWNAQFSIKKYAYDGSFNIHFFIGDISQARPQNYLHRLNEAGFSGIFASAEKADCGNCDHQRRAGAMYTDVVPLTNILVDYLDSDPASEGLIPDGEIRTISDLSPEQVVPFLKQNLKWRMTGLTGEPLPYFPDSGLEVAVAGRIFVPPTEDSPLGSYRHGRIYGQITAGKDGGYNGEDVDILVE